LLTQDVLTYIEDHATEAKQLLVDCENRAWALTQAVLRRFQKEEN